MKEKCEYIDDALRLYDAVVLRMCEHLQPHANKEPITATISGASDFAKAREALRKELLRND